MAKGIAGRLAALRDSLKTTPSDESADPAGDPDSGGLAALFEADSPQATPEFADSADAFASSQVRSSDPAATVRTRRRYGSTRVVSRPAAETAAPASTDTAELISAEIQPTHEPSPDTSAAEATVHNESTSGPAPEIEAFDEPAAPADAGEADAVPADAVDQGSTESDRSVADADQQSALEEPDADPLPGDAIEPAESIAAVQPEPAAGEALADEPVADQAVHDGAVHAEPIVAVPAALTDPAEQPVAETVSAEPINAADVTADGDSDVPTETAPVAADSADDDEAAAAGEEPEPEASAGDQPAVEDPIEDVATQDVPTSEEPPAEVSAAEPDPALAEPTEEVPAAAELRDEDVSAVDEPSDDVPAAAEPDDNVLAAAELHDEDVSAVDEPSDDDVAAVAEPVAVASAEDTVAERATAHEPSQDGPDTTAEPVGTAGASAPVQANEPVRTDEATAAAPVAVAATTRPAPTTAREAPAADHPRRTTTVLAGVAAIAAVIVVVIGLAMFFGRSSGHKSAGAATSTTATSGPATPSATASAPSTPAPSTPASSSSDGGSPSLPPQIQLGKWAKANLSPASIIVADAAAAKTLRADGFAHVVKDTSTSTDWRTVAYLIRGRAGANPSALRVQLAHAAAPLALFGTGAGEVVVSEVHPELGSGLAARIKADKTVRHQAGIELVQNSNISFSASAKKTVKAGLLDIRSASFLVQLARTTRVYVIDVVCDSAETRAGRPCRTIVVSTGDMNMLQQTLSASALSYKPISVHEIDHDAVRLQWIPAIITVAGG